MYYILIGFNCILYLTGDFMTRHAACPVIVGSKWVANKWIHESGNEFRRPCDLLPDHTIEF